jgi:hypothetical protein
MTKPRLIYFTPGSRYKEIIVPNNHEPIIDRADRWLEYFFDVIKIETDCDLGDVVRTYQPDLILFDGLIESAFKLRLTITSLDAYPEIPRAGFNRVDGLSPTRGNAFEELTLKGAEVIFVLGEPSMGEAIPAFADQIIHVPWFIDPDIFKDYGEGKTIPIGMFGSFEAPPYAYPWRASIKKPLLDNFPALYFRHPGYNPELQKDNPLMIYGSAYARTLSSCLIAPSHGGFTDIVVSKLIEIPACRTLLITQDGPGVREHGFKNGDNCIFSDPEDIVDHIKALFADRPLLDRISDAGYTFAHARHTYRQRPQLLQWYELRKNLRPGYKIIQESIFSDLRAVPESSPEKTFHLQGHPIRLGLKKIDQTIISRDLVTAEHLTRKLLSYCDYMAEPKLRLVLIKLLTGQPMVALTVMQEPINFRFNMGAVSCDPYEWALFLTSLVAAKQHELLVQYIHKFSTVHSRELSVIRALIGILLNDQNLIAQNIAHLSKQLPSDLTIHEFDNFLFPDLVDGFLTLLEQNNLHEFKEAILHAPTTAMIRSFAQQSSRMLMNDATTLSHQSM